MRSLATLAALMGIVGGCSQGTAQLTDAGTGSGTSTGTSTGSSTGSSTGGACSWNAAACTPDDAGPPCCGTCAFDRYYNVDVPDCLPACTKLSDCTDQGPFVTCNNGACVHNLCSGAGAGFTVGQLCDAGGANDGTCLPGTDGDLRCVGLCKQAGTATTTCDPSATRASPSGLCIAGLVCVIIADGGARCSPTCDPTLPDAGAICADAGFSNCTQLSAGGCFGGACF